MTCPQAPENRYLIPDQSFGYTDFFFADPFKTNASLFVTFEPFPVLPWGEMEPDRHLHSLGSGFSKGKGRGSTQEDFWEIEGVVSGALMYGQEFSGGRLPQPWGGALSCQCGK